MKKEKKQTTDTILMIQPVSFSYNYQTAVNNYFQQKHSSVDTDIQSKALHEFHLMVKKLRDKGLDIIVIKDTPEPHTPDSIFPNNWISFHSDGRVVIYPMYAENRRAERRKDILDSIADKGFAISEIIDYSPFEKKGQFLEGTGSMVFDRENKIAYAALSERTSKELFHHFCKDFGFKPVYFNAYQTVFDKRLPVYHTNVMMCIGNTFSVICLEAIDSANERTTVTNLLTESGKEIMEISEVQMHSFAGNMLQVQNKEGKHFLVMSQTAFDSFTKEQLKKLTSYNEIVTADIPTIEKYGGGSVRCMMAEVFSPPKSPDAGDF
jgi:hypothetical protein